MQVSVESISTLERKLTIGVPAERIDRAVSSRLQEFARDARIDGFRKGKAPMRVIQQRYGAGARQDVLGKVINETLQEAMTQKDLKPAGMPAITSVNDKPGDVFEFVATFEVYPEIKLQDFSKIELTRLTSEVKDSDVDTMIETLRNQRAVFHPVERAAKDGDEITLDYTGTRDGEEFAGGKAEQQKLVLGSKSMIPGFEEGIVGMKAGDEKTISVTFPADYHAENLKGASVQFKIKVHAVAEKSLPELDEAFFAGFGIKEGGIEKFRSELRTNMERELKKALANKNRQHLYEQLNKLHAFDVPQSLIDGEIRIMRQNMVQQFGAGAKNLDLEALLPADMFKDQAKERVVTGLVLSEIITQHKLKADAARVRSKLEEIAAPYGDSQQIINHYYSNPNLLNQVESMVLEEAVVDLVSAAAQVTDKFATYQEAIGRAQE